jgi:hypothetical protein
VKRIFFVIFSFIIFVSCSNDDGPTYHYELLAIEDVILPENFEYGKIYEVSLKYIQPDDCYISSDVLYEYDNDIRNVAVISTVLDDKNCFPSEFEDEISFKVQALQEGTYVFKFWQGEDDNGEPIYLVKEVPVIINN